MHLYIKKTAVRSAHSTPFLPWQSAIPESASIQLVKYLPKTAVSSLASPKQDKHRPSLTQTLGHRQSMFSCFVYLSVCSKTDNLVKYGRRKDLLTSLNLYLCISTVYLCISMYLLNLHSGFESFDFHLKCASDFIFTWLQAMKKIMSCFRRVSPGQTGRSKHLEIQRFKQGTAP